MEKINSFKKWLVALLLAFVLPAQAEVVMTDGSLVVYDPNETYVFSGTLGSDIFSIGFTLTDPFYSYTINLTMPNDMVGTAFWVLTGGIDGTGMHFKDGVLLAGESATVKMGPSDLASVTNPKTGWFSMANFDLPTPIAFGPAVSNDMFDVSAPIPEPSTWAMLLAGLGLVGFVAKRKVAAVGV